MKLLLINGSPKGEYSNSLQLTQAFVRGVKEENSKKGLETELDQLNVCKLHIEACKGCFACWKVCKSRGRICGTSGIVGGDDKQSGNADAA